MSCRWSRDMLEYFLYEAGAGRTPSLSLLPGCNVSMQFDRDKDACQVPTRIGEARGLSLANGTGILRRGEGEVLVAEVEVGCLPCVAPHCPIVSSDDPDIVCFRVCENNYGADNMLWMVEINTRSKVLLSVARCGRKYYSAGDLLPAKLHWL